jgi:hypothetical protein
MLLALGVCSLMAYLLFKKNITARPLLISLRAFA